MAASRSAESEKRRIDTPGGSGGGRRAGLLREITAFGFVAAASVALVAFAGNARAAEWSVSAKVDQRFEVDDNTRLLTSGEKTTYGSITSPELRLRGRSQVLDVNLFGKFDFSRFNESLFNTEDQLLRLASSYRTETSIWGLNAELDRDTTRTSELTDTGIFGAIARRLRYSVTPSWTAILTPRNRLRTSAGYTNVTYDTAILTDYTYVSGGATWEHDYTQKTVLTLGLNGSRYEAQSGSSSESDVYAVLLGATHKFSERLTATGTIGPRYLSTDSVTASNDSIGVQMGASAEFLMSERTSISGGVDRSVSPSGGGAPLEKSTFSLSAKHQFLPRWLFLAGATYIKDGEDTGNVADGRRYLSVAPTVRWQVGRNFDISTTYRYRKQETGGGAEADSNAVFLSLTYRPMPWILSR